MKTSGIKITIKNHVSRDTLYAGNQYPAVRQIHFEIHHLAHNFNMDYDPGPAPA
jgi:hypothetical protein